MIQFIGKTSLLRGGNCFDSFYSLLHGTFFTQWLCYKSINLRLNIIGLHHLHFRRGSRGVEMGEFSHPPPPPPSPFFLSPHLSIFFFFSYPSKLKWYLISLTLLQKFTPHFKILNPPLHLLFFFIKTSNQTIYSLEAATVPTSNILWQMFFWIRKGKVLSMEFLCFQNNSTSCVV